VDPKVRGVLGQLAVGERIERVEELRREPPSWDRARA
jgi:hypothetical protein